VTRCSVGKTHPESAEFTDAELSPLVLARVRQVFADVPLTTDGKACASCVQWLNDRRAELV
jgi:hypothetical protein